MMSFKTYLTAALCLVAASSRVHAEDAEVDVKSFEYVDVVETADGSTWKGVIVEQTPNVQYKIATADGSLHVLKAADVVKMSKQRNRDYRSPIAAGRGGGAAAGQGTYDHANGVAGAYESDGSGLPAPFARTGLRIDPEFLFVFPSGDLKNIDTSFTPSVAIGYEALFGNFGIGGGGLARFDYWRLPGMTKDAFWTLETQVYGRAALHISRVAVYGGVSLGVDTNYLYVSQVDMSRTTLGFGMNLMSGVEIAATPALGIKLGFDYHPSTDKIVDGAPGSVSYYALKLGASFRL